MRAHCRMYGGVSVGERVVELNRSPKFPCHYTTGSGQNALYRMKS